MHAMPAIRPLNHIPGTHAIIIRSRPGSATTGHSASDGAVACHQAHDTSPAGTPDRA